jgi:ribonuclease Z
VEDRRSGRFNRDKAVELGVPSGPLFGKLQRGLTVMVGDTIVTPDQVMGPTRPGRKLVYSGDTRPCEELEFAARGADLLIHDGALADDMVDWARETRHSTAGEAGALAQRASVKTLVLTHISSRYSEDATPLLEDAKKNFSEVIVAEDLMRIEIKNRDW